LSSSDTVDAGIDAYSNLHRAESTETRVSQYKQLVNSYYDLATVFYEWGWGSCFHFSFQFPYESFAESIRRHEFALAAQLQKCYGSAKHVLDVGCGIGGPARNISKFLQCKITGITLNPYQVQRGNELNKLDQHSNVTSVQGDFMELPFPKNSFDGAYAIEATCHAPDRVACYRQVYEVLKPGAIFACYEWCMTDRYDANNPEHQRLKKNIEEGNGLPDICQTVDCVEAMEKAGFEMLLESDLATIPNVQPWMTPLMPSWNPLSQRFQFNWLGAILTNIAIFALETVRFAPAGTVKTQKVLQAGGFALRDAGEQGIFTTMFLMVGKKKE
jgi:sterol 24-C-methyltransferase